MLESIVSGFVAGITAPVFLTIIVWFYNKKIKANIKWETIGITSSTIKANSINIVIQSNTDKPINIKTLKIIGKNKFIKYINVKDCYLNNSKTPYNEDYYTLKPFSILSLSIFYTQASVGILELRDKKTIIKVDNNSFYMDSEDLELVKLLYGEKSLPKSFLKKNKEKYVQICLKTFTIKNQPAEIVDHFPLSSNIRYIVHDINNNKIYVILSNNSVSEIKNYNPYKDDNFIALITSKLGNNNEYNGEDYWVYRINSDFENTNLVYSLNS